MRRFNHLFTTADLGLWARCHRQWLAAARDGSGARRPILPVEMTGESNLRELARVGVVGPHLGPDGAAVDAVADAAVPIAVRLMPAPSDPAPALALVEATELRLLAGGEAGAGALVFDGLVAGFDASWYNSRAGGWEFVFARPGTGLRGGWEIEAAAIVAGAEAIGLAVHAVHVAYLDKKSEVSPAASIDDFVGLFRMSNMVGRSRRRIHRIRDDLVAMSALLDGNTTIDEAYHCRPGCSRCRSENDPEPDRYSPLTLHKGGQLGRELLGEGIRDLRDMDQASRRLSSRQRVQVQSVQADAIHIDAARLDGFLDRLATPLWYLDFEAYAVAVPTISGVAPFGHVPVIASVHEQRAFGTEAVAHRFIAEPGSDQRVEMYRWLAHLVGDTGTIVVFSRGFESAMVRQLARTAGEDGTSLVDRMVDLLEPFADFMIYHPEQLGKVSLKRVLPVFIEGVSYEDETVKDGMHANLGYARHADRALAAGTGIAAAIGRAAEASATLIDRYSPGSTAPVPSLDDITDYCALDTLAMVHLVNRLRELAERRS